MPQPLLRRSSLCFAILATMIGASAALAQEARAFMSTDGQLSAAKPGTLPISDDAVRAIVAQHFQSSVPAGTTENAITIVVDANGNYVSGHAAKATIFKRSSTDGVTIDTAITVGSASVMVRRHADGEATPSGVVAAGGNAGSVMIARSGDGVVTAGSGTHGMFGMDVAPGQVGSFGLKHYAAGDLGFEELMVTVVKLK